VQDLHRFSRIGEAQATPFTRGQRPRPPQGGLRPRSERSGGAAPRPAAGAAYAGPALHPEVPRLRIGTFLRESSRPHRSPRSRVKCRQGFRPFGVENAATVAILCDEHLRLAFQIPSEGLTKLRLNQAGSITAARAGGFRIRIASPPGRRSLTPVARRVPPPSASPAVRRAHRTRWPVR
jgi:hypothetical protein